MKKMICIRCRECTQYGEVNPPSYLMKCKLKPQPTGCKIDGKEIYTEMECRYVRKCPLGKGGEQ